MKTNEDTSGCFGGGGDGGGGGAKDRDIIFHCSVPYMRNVAAGSIEPRSLPPCVTSLNAPPYSETLCSLTTIFQGQRDYYRGFKSVPPVNSAEI
ncbi:hypothetical protein E2C01_098683 [Portunus trituberculatus]|uniref:Uncharacterized protein n=1 Tax=Portunus trituberculatus TaxID=210409 RepID=A0A5B7KES0_PORTR|nr:hypothetical protein [Portunus trituberculatus]